MKPTKMRLRTILLATLLLSVSWLGAQTYSRFLIQPASKLWMDGTSNVHAWTVEAAELEGYVEVVLPFAQNVTGTTGSINGPRVELFVSVEGLNSGRRIMDKKMAAALKSSRHPMIHFKLQEGGISGATKSDSGSYKLVVRGVLEIAGVSKVIEMDVAARFLPDGRLTIEGRKSLKMSSFGVETPKALGGLIVTGDEIEIRFELETTVDPSLVSLFLQSWKAYPRPAP